LAQEKKDILSLDDIKLLVDTFYDKVREDKLIGPIFDERIQDRWPQHLAKMYTFWQTILLGEHTYYGRQFAHIDLLPFEHSQFDICLSLLAESL
jgi:hemoglobin